MQKILIVEDDIDIQDILKNHLIDAGYEVAVASDGVAGIAMFGDTIDLVLLDIMLPKIDGYGVCEVIRRRSQVPIIILLRFRMKKTSCGVLNSRLTITFQSPFRPKSCCARLRLFFAVGLRKIKINPCLLIKSWVWTLTDSMYIKAETRLF